MLSVQFIAVSWFSWEIPIRNRFFVGAVCHTLETRGDLLAINGFDCAPQCTVSD